MITMNRTVGSGGIIAVNTRGEFSMEFNSKGMFRGVCDSNGNCSIGIWEEMIPIKVNVDFTTAPSGGVVGQMESSPTAIARDEAAVEIIDASSSVA